MTFSTPHTRDTSNPQDYWQHLYVTTTNSPKLIWLGIVGFLHGIFTEVKWMQFYTSSGVLEIAKKLIDSRRHDKEIERIFGQRFLQNINDQRVGKV
jgi:hypothetical protein